MSTSLVQIVDALSAYAEQRASLEADARRDRAGAGRAAPAGITRDRRAHVRLRPIELDRPMLARLKAGPLLRLIDISAGGALIEAQARLTPGAHVYLEFLAPGTGHATVVRSRVTRSQVSSLDDGLRYRGACSFEQLLLLGEFASRADRPYGGADSALSALAGACAGGTSATRPSAQGAVQRLRRLLDQPLSASDRAVATLLEDTARLVHGPGSPRRVIGYVDQWLRRHVPLLTLRIRAATSPTEAAADALAFDLHASDRRGSRLRVEFRPACTLDESQLRLLEAGALVMSLVHR